MVLKNDPNAAKIRLIDLISRYNNNKKKKINLQKTTGGKITGPERPTEGTGEHTYTGEE